MDLRRPSLKQAIEERIGPRTSGTDARPTWRCPFHVDTNPSFGTIPNSDPERWKCFGCGEFGDVFDFIAQYDKRALHEVLREYRVCGERRSP